MSDEPKYHYDPQPTGEQIDNLLTLGRYLVTNSGAIDARGGLAFLTMQTMDDALPPPGQIGEAALVAPPLAYGPAAGVAPLPDESWADYVRRAFCVVDATLQEWLQGPGWAETEPSAVGAALRIAYVLDYGFPSDAVAISWGDSDFDYDDDGFLWDRLDMLPPGYTGGPFVRWPRKAK